MKAVHGARGSWPCSSRRGARRRPSAEAWTPDLPAELRESCRKAPVGCRQAAEQLAGDRSTDEQAFGALKAFSAACEASDATACEAVDTRFKKPRYLGSTPVPHLPAAVLVERPNGEWKATCQFTREGQVTACRVDQEDFRVEPAVLDWIRQGPWSPPTLDGRPFGCEYELGVRWSRSHS
jgi:hypothetical protein